MRHPTSRRARGAAALACAVALAACGRPASPSPTAAVSASASATPAVARPAPLETFRLEPWKSGRSGVAPVTPPGELLVPWRVFVNQERPRQKKNPLWRWVEARQAVELEMSSDGRYRCIVNPLDVRGRPNEEDNAVEAWVLTRKVLCSSDGWQTWTESPHQVVVMPDGKIVRPFEQTEVLLREPMGGGKVRETTVLMRSDKPGEKRPPPEL